VSAISALTRITAIADVFDVLSHERPYKRAWPLDDSATAPHQSCKKIE
jgi:putative two-component system response regulator